MLFRVWTRSEFGAIPYNCGLVSGGSRLPVAAAIAGAAETWVGEESAQKTFFYNVLRTLERSQSNDD